MTTTTRRAAVALVIGALATTTACTTTPPTELPAPASPVTAPNSSSQAAGAALAAYDAFWDVSLAASAEPNARDWAAEFATVASGEALNSVSADIANYADFPAHFEGTINREPTVETAAPMRVEIIDCLDVSAYLLRADDTGEVLTDTANQPPRYRFVAALVPNASGRWLVDQIEPRLSESC